MNPTASATPSQADRQERLAVIAAYVFLALALALVGWQNRHQLNTDGVAYLRLAHYYATGQLHLAVSGYWGPLLSWLIAPLLAIGVEPLNAARTVMALSALLFVVGCHAVFRAFQLSVAAQVRGLWLCVLSSVFWSVRNITPDLLLGSLMALAIASLVEDRWVENRLAAVRAGFFWGLAYLAKAVAFPLALGITLIFVVLRRRTRSVEGPKLLRSFSLTVAVFFLVAAPWMLTLSVKYQRLIFSTSGLINHAIVGPPDVERYHPFVRSFHQPEPGRVTQWEDPSNMAYHPWSPFESKDRAWHQVKIIAQNLWIELKVLGGADLTFPAHLFRQDKAQVFVKAFSGFDLFWFGVLALVACAWLPAPRLESLARERWRWALVPVGCLMAIYLPVYLVAEEQRYFYPAYPFLWVAVAECIEWLWLRRQVTARSEARGALFTATLSFGVIGLVWLMVAFVGLPNPAAVSARQLADKLRVAKIEGSIAGSGLLQGGRAAFYTAYFLGQPWHGDELSPTAEGFKKSGARLVIVTRHLPLNEALQTDAGFRDLDAALFPSPEEAARFPLKVFRLDLP
jgi:hypothetical protein